MRLQLSSRRLAIFLAFATLCATSWATQSVNAETSPSVPLVADTTMTLVKTIQGEITPKSVRSSGAGLVSAQNMMYRHSVTIYNAKTMALESTIPDRIKLADFGYLKYPGSYLGAPVEGAFSPDGKYLYVTNYAMYGKGFDHEGHDDCKANNPYDKSFLYRIDLSTRSVDAIYPVGKVPKVVQVTPDNKFLLVTNWCSYDLTVISIDSGKTVKNIYIGAYPRGIVVTKDSKFAYVAHMGGNTVHRIRMSDFSDSKIYIGLNPRALVLSPDEGTIYATLNLSGKVVALDLASRKIVHSITTGKATRSLDISTDGSALFVVNFGSATLSKIRTSDFRVTQTIKVCTQPIGITYEATQNRTWVACYLGSIKVFDNK